MSAGPRTGCSRTKSKDKVLGRNTSGTAVTVPFTFGRARAVVGVLAAAVSALALSVAPAQASTGHTFSGGVLSGFGGGSPGGIALETTSSDVFATDPGNADGNGGPAPRVQRFQSDGTPVSAFAIDPALYNSPQAIAIDSTNDVIYVGVIDNTTSQGAVLEFQLDGTPAGTLTATAGTAFNNNAIAVNPSNGDVYVGATDSTLGTPLVEVFTSAGAPKASFDGSSGNDSALAGIGSIAVDGASRVYVTDPGKNRVDRFNAAGAFQSTVVDGNARGLGVGALAADASTNEVYVVENGGSVELLNPAGATHLDTFGSGGFAVNGIAVNPATHTAYTSDPGQSLGLIATAFAGPTVTTGSPATGVTATDATVSGTVDPEGNATSFRFDYGTDLNYGSSSAVGPVGSDSTGHPVSDALSNLLPNTTYHYLVVGIDDATQGTVSGADQTFQTALAPPILNGTPSATAIQPDGATLNATVDARGSDTNWHFEYGTTTAYGTSSATNTVFASQGDQPVNVQVTGLTPGTTYHFRIVANNGTGGDQTGADGTFRTAPTAAAGASSVTGASANLVGTVNPQGHATTYHFEYGESAPAYGTSTPERSAGSASGETTVTATIGSLKAGTTYHVRVIATDTTTGVVTTGVDGTFTTNPAPGVVTGAVTGVTTDQATFSGTVDTHGLGGTYRFYVQSTGSPFTGHTETGTIAPGAAAGTVSSTLGGLPPGQNYIVRLSVESSEVTTVGDAVTFATAPTPVVNPPAPPPTVTNPYGCASPVLKAYNSHPKPGDTITVSGTDLGVGGTVALGGDVITPSNWTASSFTIDIPDGAKGSLPLTVNCGKASNTIAIQMFQAPSNTFATPKGKVKGSTVTVTLKVPGAGDITVKGPGLKTAKKHAGKAGSYTVKATLSASGKKSLRRHGRLARTLTVSFKPNGGTSASKHVKVTFKR